MNNVRKFCDSQELIVIDNLNVSVVIQPIKYCTCECGCNEIDDSKIGICLSCFNKCFKLETSFFCSCCKA